MGIADRLTHDRLTHSLSIESECLLVVRRAVEDSCCCHGLLLYGESHRRDDASSPSPFVSVGRT